MSAACLVKFIIRRMTKSKPIQTGILGAAAAALAGYLRDIGWQGKQTFTILQGEDMGVPSRLLVQYSSKIGESVSVSGEVRNISTQ